MCPYMGDVCTAVGLQKQNSIAMHRQETVALQSLFGRLRGWLWGDPEARLLCTDSESAGMEPRPVGSVDKSCKLGDVAV